MTFACVPKDGTINPPRTSSKLIAPLGQGQQIATERNRLIADRVIVVWPPHDDYATTLQQLANAECSCIAN
ncbi:WD-40 repeat-containing protein [Anopheles sinensis]|uniref:WD-40 repeat-containing protein n=1 Tax=Anopheles sinensis TaxID=74873 RepID=A0A084WGR1_ANOSI|nr:WD-40 repeat-containing protein [Anopheles sinensis]